MFGGWRGLGLFWTAVLGTLAIGTATLHHLGPPPNRTVVAKSSDPSAPPSKAIAAPDQALLEPLPGAAGFALPKISTSGERPMKRYAAPFDNPGSRPRVALMIAGIGMSSIDSRRAIDGLPREISLAISPYAATPEPTLTAARAAGHELLLSIPMEPTRFPLADPGPKALMTTLSPEQNRPNLLWALSRISGYAGTTAVLGELNGEKFAAVAEQLDEVLVELDHRGLFFVAAPGSPAHFGREATRRSSGARGIRTRVGDQARPVECQEAAAKDPIAAGLDRGTGGDRDRRTEDGTRQGVHAGCGDETQHGGTPIERHGAIAPVPEYAWVGGRNEAHKEAACTIEHFHGFDSCG